MFADRKTEMNTTPNVRHAFKNTVRERMENAHPALLCGNAYVMDKIAVAAVEPSETTV
jgi:hypothetical protein